MNTYIQQLLIFYTLYIFKIIANILWAFTIRQALGRCLANICLILTNSIEDKHCCASYFIDEKTES